MSPKMPKQIATSNKQALAASVTIDREYWHKTLREAERDLEAARTRSAVNAAARKVMRARQELKRLEQAPAGRPKRRRSDRGSAAAGASS